MRFLLLTALGFVATAVNAGWHETSIPRRDVMRKQLRARTGDLPSLLNGTIEVIQGSDGSSLGYITDAGFNGLVGTGAVADAYKVSFTPTLDGKMQILVKSPAAGLPNLGLSAYTSATFDSNAAAYGPVVRQDMTSDGPQNVDNSYTDTGGTDNGSESAIWTYNAFSTELTATWVNPTGSNEDTVPLQLYYTDGYLGGTGSFSALQSNIYPDAVQVQFYFRPSV